MIGDFYLHRTSVSLHTKHTRHRSLMRMLSWRTAESLTYSLISIASIPDLRRAGPIVPLRGG